jgi:antitoxin ParD1/3/4
MPTRTISLSDQFDSFISAGIEEGRYGDASEVVREGLRLLQQRDAEDRARIEWLRGAVQQGIDEIELGEGVEFASVDDLADHIHAIGDEVSRERVAGLSRA